MITQYFFTQEKAWSFALNLDKSKFQVIDYGKIDGGWPYFVTYAPR